MTSKCIKTGHSRLRSPLVIISVPNLYIVLPARAGMKEEGVCSQQQFVTLEEHVWGKGEGKGRFLGRWK